MTAEIIFPENEPSVMNFIMKEIFEFEIYDCYKQLTTGMNVIDLGAHVGAFTVKAASLGANVMAFEPNSEILPFLRENTKNLFNVQIVEKAVSNYDGIAYIQYVPNNSAGTYITEEGDIPTSVTRMDTVLSQQHFTPIDLVKIDVEGQELEALQGFGDYLGFVDFFSIASYHYFGESQKIRDFLEQNGFSVFTRRFFGIGLNNYLYAWRLW
mgnify:CR=1 FL=1